MRRTAAPIHEYSAWCSSHDSVESSPSIFSSSRKPSEVVELVTQLFATFDQMTEELNLFKVCTIGDAYIAVNMPTLERVEGIEKSPHEMPNGAKRSLESKRSSLHSVDELTPVQMEIANQLVDAHHLFQLASGMLAHIQRVAETLDIDNLNMRIGIHRGNFVGGVIGSDRLRFDIWGVDVCTATECESSGKPGKLNVSASMREFLDEYFGSRFVYEFNVTFIDMLDTSVDTFLTYDRCFEQKW